MNSANQSFTRLRNSLDRAANKKRLAAASVLLFLMVLGFAISAAATCPCPVSGTATVDGDDSDWNLANTYFADMTRAGKVDANHPTESKVYLMYDGQTETLYVLVLTVPGVTGIASQDDAWVAINKISNKVVKGDSGNNGVPPDFAWVGKGYDGNQNHVLGYEASFKLSSGQYPFLIHLQVFDDNECQTSATTLCIKVNFDDHVIPETPYGLSIVAMVAAAATFAIYKKQK